MAIHNEWTDTRSSPITHILTKNGVSMTIKLKVFNVLRAERGCVCVRASFFSLSRSPSPSSSSSSLSLALFQNKFICVILLCYMQFDSSTGYFVMHTFSRRKILQIFVQSIQFTHCMLRQCANDVCSFSCAATVHRSFSSLILILYLK